SIGGLFLLVKAYYGIEKQGLAMRLGKEGGSVAALLRNQITFWSSYPARRDSPPSRGQALSTIQTDLSGSPFFTMRYDCMYSFRGYSGSPL
ncbi:MAG: hypothetical protein D4R93_01565, partial [Deltaproteobacteria bacterium]